jgi:hypothetical protein
MSRHFATEFGARVASEYEHGFAREKGGVMIGESLLGIMPRKMADRTMAESHKWMIRVAEEPVEIVSCRV